MGTPTTPTTPITPATPIRAATRAAATTGPGGATPTFDRALVRAGGGLAVLGGVLRVPASLKDGSDPTALVEALYLVIDLGILFGVLAAFVAEPAGRTRTGAVGFAASVVGAALLVGPAGEGGATWFVGSALTTVGLTVMAVAWRHGRVVPRWVGVALGIVVVAGLAGSAVPAVGAAAGALFGVALAGLGVAVVRRAG